MMIVYLDAQGSSYKAPSRSSTPWTLLGGSRGRVSRLTRGIVGAVVWLIGVIHVLTQSPWPSKHTFKFGLPSLGAVLIVRFGLGRRKGRACICGNC